MIRYSRSWGEMLVSIYGAGYADGCRDRDFNPNGCEDLETVLIFIEEYEREIKEMRQHNLQTVKPEAKD